MKRNPNLKKRLHKILEGTMEFLFIGGCVLLAVILGIGPYLNPLPYYEIMVAALSMILISLGYELATTKAKKQ